MARDPVVDLREIARLLERAGGQTRRAQAFRRAADTIAALVSALRLDDIQRVPASGPDAREQPP